MCLGRLTNAFHGILLGGLKSVMARGARGLHGLSMMGFGMGMFPRTKK